MYSSGPRFLEEKGQAGTPGSSDSRQFPPPLLDGFAQHPPKVQFQVEPLAPHAVPEGDGVGGRGEFGGEAFQSVTRVANNRAMVIHGCPPLLGPAPRRPQQALVSVLGKLSGQPVTGTPPRCTGSRR